jgi:5-hydroxyisourate hydrolase
MGKLTTHVLDTATGAPAQGIKIEVFNDDQFVRSVTTNSDGRVDGAVLENENLKVGAYELRFHTGDYLRRTVSNFPIRFGIADASQHYHVPLLLSPFGYSTYRGS